MNLHRRAAACLLLFPLLARAYQQLPPFDEAPSDPEFVAVRAGLIAAVQRRDAAAVRRLLHPDVKLSFGGDEGLAAFDRLWTPRSPRSALWPTLSAALSLVGSFSPDGSFTAPYVFSRWPADVDPIGHAAVIAQAVNLRSAPAASASVLRRLDHAIVALSPPDQDARHWTEVRTLDGTTGFVSTLYLRSPLDYRVRFAKVDGRWRITMFLAAD